MPEDTILNYDPGKRRDGLEPPEEDAPPRQAVPSPRQMLEEQGMPVYRELVKILVQEQHPLASPYFQELWKNRTDYQCPKHGRFRARYQGWCAYCPYCRRQAPILYYAKNLKGKAVGKARRLYEELFQRSRDEKRGENFQGGELHE